MYLILEKITLKKNMAFMGVIFFLLSTPVATNFYRLGTDEPLQLLLILSAVYLWLKEKDFWVLILLIFSLFTKETSIFFMFLSLIYFFKKRRKLFVINLLAIILFGGLVVYKYLLPNSGYIRNANLSWDLLKMNFEYAWEYFLAELFVFSILVWRAVKYRRNRNVGATVGRLILAGSLPLGFWYMNQDYYFLVITAFLVIGFGYIAGLFIKKTNVLLLSVYILVLFVNLNLWVIPIAA